MNNKVTRADALEFNKEFICTEIHLNQDIAELETNAIYGSLDDIVMGYDEPIQSQILKERQAFYDRTLEFLFKLSILNYPILLEPKWKSFEDMPNVVRISDI